MEKMKDLAAHAGGVDVAALAPILEIERLKSSAEDLMMIGIQLLVKEQTEPNGGRAMALSMARREIARLAAWYNHDALRLSLEAST